MLHGQPVQDLAEVVVTAEQAFLHPVQHQVGGAGGQVVAGRAIGQEGPGQLLAGQVRRSAPGGFDLLAGRVAPIIVVGVGDRIHGHGGARACEEGAKDEKGR